MTSLMSYNDVRCCRSNRSLDNLLQKFEMERNSILEFLFRDPDQLFDTLWGAKGHLSVDDVCLSQLGKITERTTFHCSQCYNMGKLVDFKLFEVGKPFLVECGREVGKNLQITENNISLLSGKNNYALFSRYDNQGIGCDSFTAKIIVTWLFEDILAKCSLPHHCCRLYTAFVCRGSGYCLSQHPEIADISHLQRHEELLKEAEKALVIKARVDIYRPLRGRIVKSILLQLLVLLDIAQSFGMMFGCPSSKIISFKNEPVAYRYGGVSVTSPITLVFNDYSESSIQIGGLRLGVSSKEYELCHLQKKDVSAPETITTGGISYYKLRGDNIYYYSIMRHYGCKFFSSFDFYCFFISFLMDKSFYATMQRREDLCSMFQACWLASQLPLIHERLQSYHNQWGGDAAHPFTVVRDMLHGIYLREDISFLWEWYH